MKQYLNLLKTIKEKGSYKEPARENMPGTTSLFGYQFRHNLKDGFPLLTTKKIYWKGVVMELLWFLRGDTNIKFLDDHGVKKMWHEDAYAYYCKLCKDAAVNPMSFAGFITSIEVDDLQNWTNLPHGFKLGNCGHQYGELWRNFNHAGIDQILEVIKSLLKNPYGRRHIVTAWNPERLDDMALNACHALFQFNCRKLTLDERIAIRGIFIEDQARYTLEMEIEESLDEDKIPKYYLDCQMYQRSADVFLGVPLNTASYALLIHVIAKICNMVPGHFIHSFGDVHIYDNHKEQVNLQLSREVKKLPILKLSEKFGQLFNSQIDVEWIVSSSKNLTLFFESLEFEDFKLEGYDPHPAIKADLSTGIKK